MKDAVEMQSYLWAIDRSIRNGPPKLGESLPKTKLDVVQDGDSQIERDDGKTPTELSETN